MKEAEKKPNLTRTHLRNARLASLDGDCDRLMYYGLDENNEIFILDGDKQICLLYSFIKPFIDNCPVKLTVKPSSLPPISPPILYSLFFWPFHRSE